MVTENQVQEPSGPFESEQQAFGEGMQVFIELRHLRGMVFCKTDECRSEQLISGYCMRIKKSDIGLASIQRTRKLTNQAIMAVVYGLLGYMGFLKTSMAECTNLIAGPSPPANLRFHAKIRSGRLAPGLLDNQLNPCWTLLSQIAAMDPISLEEVSAFRRDLKMLPSAHHGE